MVRYAQMGLRAEEKKLDHRGHGGPQGKGHRGKNPKRDALVSQPLPGATALKRSSLFCWFFLFLDGHVFQFTGLENVSTFLTFHIFGFLVAGDDLDPGMLTLFPADFWRGLRRLACRHRFRASLISRKRFRSFAGKWTYFRTLVQDVKYPGTRAWISHGEMALSCSPVESCRSVEKSSCCLFGLAAGTAQR